jgi:hypothetical protein
MINDVYQMCLALLNKNNYGYMTPQEFNLFAEQAQLDIFEDLFMDYNMQIHKSAGRRSNVGYPDLSKGLEETISIFSETVALRNTYTVPPATGWNVNALPEVSNKYSLPQDYYLINKLFYCTTLLVELDAAVITGTGASYTDRANYFQYSGVAPAFSIQTGDYVVNLLPAGNILPEYPVSTVVGTQVGGAGVAGTINVVDRLSWIDGLVFPSFKIYAGFGRSGNNVREIEKVSQKKIFNLGQSNLTKPTTMFPAYVLTGDRDFNTQSAEIYPLDINQYGMVMCQYIRYPKKPNLTNINSGPRPIFDPTAADYQDFELPLDYFQDLVARILQYGGLTIREVQAIQYGQALESGESTEVIQK